MCKLRFQTSPLAVNLVLTFITVLNSAAFIAFSKHNGVALFTRIIQIKFS